jgi:rubrerythrin
MFFFIAFLICMATALFIGAPLFQRGRGQAESGTVGFHSTASSSGGTPTNSALEERRDTLLLTLKELEFDHSMGKIDESDYARLRAATTTEAATVLSQLEEAHARVGVTGSTGAYRSANEAALRDAEIEAEVLVARARRKREKSVKSPQASAWLCAQCGRAMNEEDRFCATCGTPRPQTVSA